MSNTNCLKGMQCPNEDCGSFGPYRIAVRAVAEMWDDGSDGTEDVEFEDASYCQCVMCSREGTVFNFKKGEEGKQPFADHKDKEPVGRPMADYAREGLGPSRSAMILPCHGDKPR